MLAENASAFIARVYAATSDEAAWHGMMDDLHGHLDARFLFVTAVDTVTQDFSRARFYGADDGRFLDAVTEYREGRFRDDPSLLFAATNPAAGVWDSRHAIAAPDYRDHPYIRWSIANLGASHWTVRYSAPIGGLTFGVSVGPPTSSGALDGERAAWFALLFGHLENAVRLSARPPDLSAREEALLLIDARGRVAMASPAAEAMLAVGDGLRIEAGALTAGASADQAALDAMLGNALSVLETGHLGGAVRIARPSGLRQLIVTARPIPTDPGHVGAFRGRALVKIVDPEAGPRSRQIERWRRGFGFTPAETRIVTMLLTEDRDLRDVADALAIAYGTARVHLRNIFEKTGVRTQMQLARLLTRT